MVEATIEVLAIPSVLRGNLTQKKAESGSAVLSTTLPGGIRHMQAWEQRIKRKRSVLSAEVRTAEKDGKGRHKTF
jgi:hypothetical protein